jgi:hypothetical protein
MATKKTPDVKDTKKLRIKDLTGKDVPGRDAAKVKGGVRIICYSQSNSGGVHPR